MNTPERTFQVLDPQVWEILRSSHAAYQSGTSPVYDEVLTEVAEKIRATASIGKADIGALLFWKRLRADTTWVRELMTRPEQDVRTVTAKAVAAVNDQSLTVPEAASAGRGELSSLPGFKTGDALASALLLAAAPGRMAVYDDRAQAALETLGLSLSAARGRYGRYMALVEDLRTTANMQGHAWTARDVDTALFWLGGPSKTQPGGEAHPTGPDRIDEG
ncbi:hypothetical protein [Arthrobacter bambusae]|uniref:hypothetical protein n=1 Tax=Arthrobacter bambusae TaxID=1338426 RepID=UPI00277DAF13|nr:hypothetical protein [Arthrobacter bambusae]MDQ0241451.1 hypothetical protein [Arthrobacter bambusae]